MTNSSSLPQAWRKSTRSNSGADQNCLEAGTCPHLGIAIRDSKLPTTGTYPTLAVSPSDWDGMIAAIREGVLDR